MFQAVNIFQWYFNNKLWRDLLNEYIKHNFLDESTLWKNYLEGLIIYLAKFDIQENIDLDLWIFADKNTDVISYCFANLTVRKLCEIERMQSYLLINKQLFEINHATIYL